VSNLPRFDKVEAIADASPEQWAKWKVIVNDLAPDLAEMLGVES
jgi:hypothetical protein